MPKKIVQMTEDEWMEKFRPINEDMLDTGGIYHSLYKGINPRHIWTICSDGQDVIESGWHVVNAIGVYITAFPCPKNTFIYVVIEPYDDDESNTENVTSDVV